jgi:hypothetical protein
MEQDPGFGSAVMLAAIAGRPLLARISASATVELRGLSIGLQLPALPVSCFPYRVRLLRLCAPARRPVSRAVPIATGLPRPDSPVRSPAPVAPPRSGGCSEECELSKKLYVGNLSFSTTEDELRTTFERHGGVGSVSVITDRETGRSRGFAFVEMDDASAADDAVRALDGSDLGGRSLRVNEAEDRQGGGGGRGGGRGGRY